MRRKRIPQQNVYITNRINQLKEDMARAHDEHDRNWYNRLIQELTWAKSMSSKPTENCYMSEKITNV